MIDAGACVPVSWLRLERVALGELPAGERAEVADHLAGCARCRACADRIAADARDLPPLLLPSPAAATAVQAEAPALPARPPRRRPRIDWRQALAGVAAAVIVTVALRPGRPPPGPGTGPRVVAIKGGDVTIELVRERDGSVALEPTSFAPGDRFKLLLTCPPPLQLHADVAVLQDGAPAYPGAPALIACGNRVPLPTAFRITGAGAATVCVAVDPSAPPARAALAGGDTTAAGAHACLRLERSE
jgi:hypothetical protein